MSGKAARTDLRGKRDVTRVSILEPAFAAVHESASWHIADDVFAALKVGYGVGPSAATTSTNVRIRSSALRRRGNGVWVLSWRGPCPAAAFPKESVFKNKLPARVSIGAQY